MRYGSATGQDQGRHTETVEQLELTEYGETAHAFVVYQARFKTPADLAGQYRPDSLQLVW